MSFFNCELVAELEYHDGHTFQVSIGKSFGGYVRMGVECFAPDSDETVNSQGIDLSPAECRSLAKMLEAAAIAAEGWKSEGP